jgi:putative ATP-binding cassette transporter
MSVLLILFRMVGGWLLLAVVAGLISGFSNASLLAMINHSLTLPQEKSALAPGIQFALLALLMLATRIVSQTTFMFLGQKVKAHLRGELRHVSQRPAGCRWSVPGWRKRCQC